MNIDKFRDGEMVRRHHVTDNTLSEPEVIQQELPGIMLVFGNIGGPYVGDEEVEVIGQMPRCDKCGLPKSQCLCDGGVNYCVFCGADPCRCGPKPPTINPPPGPNPDPVPPGGGDNENKPKDDDDDDDDDELKIVLRQQRCTGDHAHGSNAITNTSHNFALMRSNPTLAATLDGFRQLAQTSLVENSMTLYKEGSDYKFRNIVEGTENEVSIERIIQNGNVTNIAYIHNHPHDHGPSALDVLAHIESQEDFSARDCFVLTNTGDLYSLRVYNVGSALNFVNQIQVDVENRFAAGTDFRNSYDRMYNQLGGMTNPETNARFTNAERHNLAMTYVLDHHNTGIAMITTKISLDVGDPNGLQNLEYAQYNVTVDGNTITISKCK